VRRSLVCAAALAVGLSLALTACVAGAPTGDSSGGSSPGGSSARSGQPGHSGSGATGTPSATSTPDPLAGLSLKQVVGQLFIVGTTATAAQAVTISAVRDRDAGGIFLSGRSSLGTARTAGVVHSLTNLAPSGLPLLVSTDQEGGQVQVLSGTGFSTIPNGLVQGGMSPAALHTAAGSWGKQLASAGVNLDLAPVVDLVGSAQQALQNPPIGVFRREFGYSAPLIVSHADAFRAGMSSSGVDTVIKHFPGLGFVTKNTDTSANVTDTAVTAGGADVGIYRSEIAAGAPVIMVSSAVYAKIDPSAPAVFSPMVVTSLLRDQLGFSGVVMTDDLSGATQVLSVPAGDRAIRAIEAGVDIVLVSRDPQVAAAMMDAVLAKAQSDPAFAAKVDAAAKRVIALKRSLRG
jgi:beta-N-acetylhexosaminidase